MKRKIVTSTDVAHLAGVSQSTVSLILNGRAERFAPDTVGSVMDAVQALGYEHRPRGAKNQASGNSDKIIAIFSSSLLNPYYPELIMSIERAAEKEGFSSVIFETGRRPAMEQRYLAVAKSLKVAGIIFTYMPTAIDVVQSLQSLARIVVVGDKDNQVALDAVEFNSFMAGRLLADHLVALGHRQIAFISTPHNTGNIARVRRLEGIKQGLRDHDLEQHLIVKLYAREAYDPNHIRSSERCIGFDYATDILHKHPGITAFVGHNDVIAYGILDAMHAAGRRVPKDISVCGFDNLSFSSMSGISLTSVDYFSRVKGQDALEILLRKRNRNDTGAQVVFKMEVIPQIVVRSTTGPAPKIIAKAGHGRV